MRQQTTHTPADLWDDDFDNGATTAITNYVPAMAPRPQPRQPAPAPAPVDVFAAPALHTSHAIDNSDEVVRARGFVWRVSPLALAFAVAAAGVAFVAGAGAGWAIVLLFLVFAGVWLVALVWHVQRSPAGIAWMQARSLWGMAREQQRYNNRVDWYERTRRHGE
jgi:fatty acid desaturase